VGFRLASRRPSRSASTRARATPALASDIGTSATLTNLDCTGLNVRLVPRHAPRAGGQTASPAGRRLGYEQRRGQAVPRHTAGRLPRRGGCVQGGVTDVRNARWGPFELFLAGVRPGGLVRIGQHPSSASSRSQRSRGTAGSASASGACSASERGLGSGMSVAGGFHAISCVATRRGEMEDAL
jgi:hypothetical protein